MKKNIYLTLTLLIVISCTYQGCSFIKKGEEPAKKNDKADVAASKSSAAPKEEMQVVNIKKDKKTAGNRFLKKIEEKKDTKEASQIKEEKAEELTGKKKAIKIFEEFLEKNKDTKDRELIADTTLKIAELYFRDEEERYLTAMKQYDEVIQKAGFNELTELVPPSYDFSKAIEYYSSIIDNFPAYKKLDAAHYGLAYCYYEQNQKDIAQSTFKKLVKTFPNSIYANESSMRIGEHYFTTNQFDSAADIFETMLKNKDNPYHNVILYKLGWTYFSQGDFPNATKTFLSIKKDSGIGDTTTISRGLFNEAMNYVARIFSGTSGMLGMINYFKENPDKKDYIPTLMRFLGDAYKVEEKYERAIETYNKFLELYPDLDTAPIVEHSIIEVNEKTLKKKEEVISDLKGFIEKYDINTKRFKDIKDEIIKGEVLRVVKIAEARIALYNREVHTLFNIIEDVYGIKDTKGVQKYLRPVDKEIVKNISFKNISIIFVNSTGVEGLLNYVEGNPSYKIHLPDILKTLASIYKEEERQWQAVQAYQVLLEKYPGLEDAPIIQNTIVQIYEQGNKIEEAMEERKAFINKFNPESTWYNTEKINADRRWGTISLAEKSLRTIALYHHARSQKDKKPEDLKEAISYYEKYLKFFPDNSHTLEMTFYLAELLNEFNKPDEAIIYYEKVAWPLPAKEEEAKDDKKTDLLKKEADQKAVQKILKFRIDSAYAIIFIYDTLRINENYLGPYSRGFIKTVDTFQKYYPSDPRTPELLFKAGEILFKMDKNDEAQTFFSRLIDNYPRSPLASESIKIVAQAHFEAGRYNEAEKWYATALTSTKPTEESDAESEESIKKMLASSKFKKAEEMQKAGKLIEAGEEFMALSTITPDPLVASIALFNAGINFKSAERCDLLFNANTILLSKYSDSKFAQGVMIDYLNCEEKKGEFIKSAQNITDFIMKNPHIPNMSEPLFISANFYKKGGDIKKAKDAYILFSSKFSNDPKAIEALSNIADIEYERRNLKEAERYYKEIYLSYTKLADKSTETFYAAKAKFMLGEIMFEDFKKAKIVEPVEKSLANKQKLMEQILLEYTQSAGFKISEWTVASTYKIGMVFEEMKNSIISSDKPAGLSEVELEDYNILLEEQAFPFEEKAMTAYQANMQRLYTDTVYNKWIEQTIERLAYLFPWSYDKKEDAVKDSNLFVVLEDQ